MSVDPAAVEPADRSVMGASVGVSSGIARLAISRALTIVLQFFTLALMARVLGPSGYGLIAFGLALFVYIGLTNDLGLTILGAREHGTPDDLARTRGALLGARVFLTAAVVVVVAIVLILFPLSAEGRLVGVILTLGFVSSSLNVRWVMQADERFGSIALADGIGSCVQLLVTVLFVRGPDDIGWAAVAVVAMPVTSTGILALRAGLVRRVPVTLSRESIHLVRRAAPLGVALLATALYYSADSVLLGIFRGSDQVGYYAAAYRVVLACLAIPVVVHSVLLPVVARLQRTDPTSSTETLEGASQGLVWIALPIAVGTALTAGTVVRVVFGNAYEPSGPVLALLIWSCVTVSSNVPFAVLMLARNQDRRYMAVTVLGATVNLLANLMMIPIFGMIGAAVTTLASELIVLGAIVWYTQDVSTKILGRSFRRALPPTVIMAVALVPFRDQIGAIAIGVVAFGIGSIVTGAVPVADLRRVAAGLRGRRPSGVDDAGGR
jgi:O-antigen/teichoic acid export membrane protein